VDNCVIPCQGCAGSSRAEVHTDNHTLRKETRQDKDTASTSQAAACVSTLCDITMCEWRDCRRHGLLSGFAAHGAGVALNGTSILAKPYRSSVNHDRRRFARDIILAVSFPPSQQFSNVIPGASEGSRIPRKTCRCHNYPNIRGGGYHWQRYGCPESLDREPLDRSQQDDQLITSR